MSDGLKEKDSSTSDAGEAQVIPDSQIGPYEDVDAPVGDKASVASEGVFGDETGHQIVYRKLSWQAVAILMIAEIVSNGMLSLPSTYAVVGIVPATVLIIFLGCFALFTCFLLVDFKLLHPDVHNMGDAGYILMGWPGRELLAFGTLFFAILAAGTQVVSGGLSLQTLSNNSLCAWKYQLICGCIIFLFALPRVLDQITWLGVVAVIAILVSAIVGMGAAGGTSSPQEISVAISGTFYNAFLAVTQPVFAYAGHFMFFLLISEMRNPRDAYKSAIALQVTAITFYTTFSVVFYVYYGNDVESPAYGSLPEKWSKAAYGIALFNFLVAGALYIHTSAKIIMVRIFRHSSHLHSHTVLAWGVWTLLIFTGAVIAFIAAVAIPVFNELVALAAALFASWFCYGIAGGFWWHDHWHEWKNHKVMAFITFATIVAGAFICVAGVYASIKLIIVSYQTGEIPTPFTC